MGKVVCFGEIMMRLATPEYLRFGQAGSFEVEYGGGEANVAISLANFKLQSEFVSALPDNDFGDSAIRFLKSFGVETKNILRQGSRIGIYFLETGAVSRASKVIYDRNNSAFATTNAIDYNWDEIFKDAEWFHWTGITPAISKETAEACFQAVKAASEKGIVISCDLNYRNKLWKWGGDVAKIMEELVQYCDVILGNEEDAEKVFGIKTETSNVTSGHVHVAEYEQVCKALMKKFPKAKKVIITLRGSVNANHNTWSGVLYNGKELLQAPEYNITHIVDRVGGGDSFMGGLIFGLLHYKDDEKALNFATAASCLKHTKPTYCGGPGCLPGHPDTVNVLGRDFERGQMSRDMTLFVDDDWTAYHVHSSEENSTIHISKLSDDYLSFSGEYARAFVGRYMEAPTMFKKGGKYYFIASGCTGWSPNAARSAVAETVFGPWQELGNPCVSEGKETTYKSQSTYILPVQGKKDAFIFIADQWNPKNAIDGRYIWLPIQFNEHGTPMLEWKEKWQIADFY